MYQTMSHQVWGTAAEGMGFGKTVNSLTKITETWASNPPEGRKPEGNVKSRKFTKYKHQMQQTTQCILVTEEVPLDTGGLTPGLHLCFPL